MSVISFGFLLFVLGALLVFQLTPARLRPYVLLAASLLFYASRSLVDTLLLVLITFAVYGAAIALEGQAGERRKRRLLTLTISSLTLCLAGFKVAAACWPSSPTFSPEEGPALQVLVPLGLSYYLFKLIGYLLDVYWEKLPAQRSFPALVLYASFFPQIVSGPIQRPDDFFTQLGRTERLDADAMGEGLRRILLGLFKKLAIADRLGGAVDAVHAAPASFSSLELCIAAYLFALQLYADFSGVTDLAIGVGQLFGIKGPENFDFPFFARNLQDYWRRWHMSLTSWLADYVFTPLRMALRDWGQRGLALALLVNMVSVGVWHGASWTYLVFGLMHGTFLIVSVLTLKRRDAFFRRHPLLARARMVAAPLATFHLVVLALVVFRASSVSSALSYVAHAVPGLTDNGIAPTRLDVKALALTGKLLLGIPVVAVCAELASWAIRAWSGGTPLLRTPRAVRWALYYALILITLNLSRLGQETFIYAQF